MVLGRQNQVSHAGIAAQAHDLFGVEMDGVELRGEFFIFSRRYMKIVHDPFGYIVRLLSAVFAGKQRVQPPVNKHAEFGVQPPLHP